MVCGKKKGCHQKNVSKPSLLYIDIYFQLITTNRSGSKYGQSRKK